MWKFVVLHLRLFSPELYRSGVLALSPKAFRAPFTLYFSPRRVDSLADRMSEPMFCVAENNWIETPSGSHSFWLSSTLFWAPRVNLSALVNKICRGVCVLSHHSITMWSISFSGCLISISNTRPFNEIRSLRYLSRLVFHSAFIFFGTLAKPKPGRSTILHWALNWKKINELSSPGCFTSSS